MKNGEAIYLQIQGAKENDGSP